MERRTMHLRTKAALAAAVALIGAIPALGAATSPSGVLSRVEAARVDNVFEVRLEGQGLAGYETFELKEPPRLVVDLRGAVKSDSVPAVVPGGDAGVQQIRVGQFSDDPATARVVFDLDAPPRYRITARDGAILVAFSRPPAEGLPVQEGQASVFSGGDVEVIERSGASPGDPQRSPKLRGPQISLGRAVAVALDADPSISIAAERVRSAEGALLDSQGLFDSAMSVGFNLTLERGELLPTETRQQKQRRKTFQLFAEELQKAADGLEDQLQTELEKEQDQRGYLYVNCGQLEGQTNVVRQGSELIIRNEITGRTTVVKCPSLEEQRRDELLLELYRLQIDELRDQGRNEEADEIEQLLQDSLAVNYQVMAETIRTLNFTASVLREGQRGQGATPTLQERLTGELLLGYRVPFRNGIAVTPTLQITTTHDQFVGKKNDSYEVLFDQFDEDFLEAHPVIALAAASYPRQFEDFEVFNFPPIPFSTGGKGVKNEYRSALGFIVDVPLGRGSGAETTGTERASNLELQASRLDYRQAAAEGALGTALAYWNLVAAQQTLGILEESLGRQGRLRDMTMALVEAQEITQTDGLHVDARQSDRASQVIRARQNVFDARIFLARQMGVYVETEMDAPLASDDFPAVADPDVIARQGFEWAVKEAVSNRNDIGAAYTRDEAARVLMDTSRLGLRRPIDLQLSFGYTGYATNGNYLEGIGQTLLGKWEGPSVALNVSFEIPIDNNVALGLYAQSTASANQASIRKTDLQRVVKSRVVELLGTLSEAARAVRQFEAAAGYQQKTIEGERERFQAGESTAIDAVTTEEQLTSTMLSLVSARQQYASVLAQLRFEMGVLIAHEGMKNLVNPASLVTLPF